MMSSYNNYLLIWYSALKDNRRGSDRLEQLDSDKVMKGKGIGNSVTINKAQNKNWNDLRNIKISRKPIVFEAYFFMYYSGFNTPDKKIMTNDSESKSIRLLIFLNWHHSRHLFTSENTNVPNYMARLVVTISTMHLWKNWYKVHIECNPHHSIIV